MAYSTEHISSVRAIGFPAGTKGGDEMVSLPGLVMVNWRSEETDKLFQVYVNGQWSGATSHPRQRKLLVEYEHPHIAAIEVVAVLPNEKSVDFSGELAGFTGADGCHAVIHWPRRGVLPLGSRTMVYGDEGSGQINYTDPLATIETWAGVAEKWGYGLDGFGKGDFGYSGTGAVGWGRGSFAWGEFGFDAEIQVFISDALAAGKYQFAVRVCDTQGNFIEGEDEVVTVYLDPLPAASRVSIENYDEQNDELVLDIDQS